MTEARAGWLPSWMRSLRRALRHARRGLDYRLMRNTMEGFKGDSLTEQDEDYAKLVSATSGGQAEIVEHWRACPVRHQLLSLWVNQDGHAFIAVRGTKPPRATTAARRRIAVTGTVRARTRLCRIQRMSTI